MSDRSLTLSTAALSRLAPRGSLLDLFQLWRERRALARLDAHALRDLGLEEGAAAAEAHRPVWDVPAHWHR